jgi:uncharacterized iron-regulated protein
MLRRIFALTLLLSTSAVCALASDNLFPPAEYIQSRLQQNDIVFLGTKHKQPEILRFVAELIPTLRKQGVSHIGLEIPSDQQEKIDAFMQTGDDLDKIQFHPQIDCPEYRNLLLILRKSGGPAPVAIDLPYSMHAGDISRDQWMARQLLRLLPAKILVVVGNLHILKKLEWEEQVPNKSQSIRQYIQKERPETRMWSVGQVIDEDPVKCDFTQVFGPLDGAVALNLDYRCKGWKLGFIFTIAIQTAECFDLVDGLIVY